MPFLAIVFVYLLLSISFISCIFIRSLIAQFLMCHAVLQVAMDSCGGCGSGGEGEQLPPAAPTLPHAPKDKDRTRKSTEKLLTGEWTSQCAFIVSATFMRPNGCEIIANWGYKIYNNSDLGSWKLHELNSICVSSWFIHEYFMVSILSSHLEVADVSELISQVTYI